MQYVKPKKISVLGSAGSGKSFVAGELGKMLDLPIIYFDHYTWNPDRSMIDKIIFVENMLLIWVING